IDQLSLESAHLFGYDPARAKAALVRHGTLALAVGAAVPFASLLARSADVRIRIYGGSPEFLGICRVLRSTLLFSLSHEDIGPVADFTRQPSFIEPLERLRAVREWARLVEIPVSVLRHFETSDQPLTDEKMRSGEHLDSLGTMWAAYKWSVSLVERWLIVASALSHLATNSQHDRPERSRSRMAGHESILAAWRSRSGPCGRAADAVSLLTAASSRARASSTLCARAIDGLKPIQGTPLHRHLTEALALQRAQYLDLSDQLGSARAEAQSLVHTDRADELRKCADQFMTEMLDRIRDARMSLDGPLASINSGTEFSAELSRGIEPWRLVRPDALRRLAHLDAEYRAMGRRDKEVGKAIAAGRTSIGELDGVIGRLLDFRIAVEVERQLSSIHRMFAGRVASASQMLGNALQHARSAGGFDLASVSPDVQQSVRLLEAIRSNGVLGMSESPSLADLLPDALNSPGVRTTLGLVSDLLGGLTRSSQTPQSSKNASGRQQALTEAVRCYIAPLAIAGTSSGSVALPWQECVAFLGGEHAGDITPLGGMTSREVVESSLGLPSLFADSGSQPYTDMPNRRDDRSAVDRADLIHRCGHLVSLVSDAGQAWRSAHGVLQQLDAMPKPNVMKGLLGKASSAATSFFGRRGT
ncbi:MAG: hypothetical protein ACO31E_12090, partial [Phycisphaerales bacterium]